LLIDDSRQVEALAGTRTIIITRGALGLLSDTQLAGVLAHELGHVRAGAVVALMYMRFAPLPLLWPWYAAGALYWVWANLFSARNNRYVSYADAIGWVIGLVWLVITALALIAGVITSIFAGPFAGMLAVPVVGAAFLVPLVLSLSLPVVQVLFALDSRRMESAADRYTGSVGLGGALLEALERRAMSSLSRPRVRGVTLVLAAAVVVLGTGRVGSGPDGMVKEAFDVWGSAAGFRFAM